MVIVFAALLIYMALYASGELDIRMQECGLAFVHYLSFAMIMDGMGNYYMSVG